MAIFHFPSTQMTFSLKFDRQSFSTWEKMPI